MQISRKELKDQQIEFVVTPEMDHMKDAKAKALEKLGKEVSVPGFRKGKAPIKEIQKRVGGYRLFQETLEILAEAAYREVLEKEKVFPLAQPSIDIKGEDALIEDKTGITFTITVTVRPEPKLPTYKKLGVKYQTPSVTTEQTEDALKALFERWKEDHEKAKTENEKSESEGADDKNLDTEKPSDEWAKSMGANDMKDLKERLHQNLMMEQSYVMGNQFTRDVLDTLVTKTKMDLPMQLVLEDLEKRKEKKLEELEKIGMDLDGFAKQQKTTVEEIEKIWLDELKKEYAIEFIVASIAEKEDITVSDEEIEAEINASQDQDALKLFDDPQRKEHLRYLMRRDKTVRRVVEWNMEEESKKDSKQDDKAKEEKPKKKTASKTTKKPTKKKAASKKDS